jgi:hypothetical protein
MALLASTTYESIEHMAQRLAVGLRSTRSLEAAAERFVGRLAEEFPSIVLARVFGTMPFSGLPPAERAAARVAADGLTLLPNTDTLTLFATVGARPQWNERRRSQAHLAIPLVSSAHVDNIPMVSRLLKDLRYRLDDGEDATPFVTRALANANGLFYVPDAATTLDEKGRRVIPASDFVRDHAIQTVFGFGGAYAIHPMFVSAIVFTQESITKQTAMRFLQLSSVFKAGTARLVNRGLLFADEPAASRKV